MSRTWRIVVAAGVVAAAVVLFVLLRPGDDDEEAVPTTTAPTTTRPSTTTVPTTTRPATTTTATPSVTVLAVSVPASGPERIVRWRVSQGERVRIVVRLGAADEVHLHGYDLEAETGPGQPPARLDFRATTPGRFELELHESGQQIAELRVDP